MTDLDIKNFSPDGSEDDSKNAEPVTTLYSTGSKQSSIGVAPAAMVKICVQIVGCRGGGAFNKPWVTVPEVQIEAKTPAVGGTNLEPFKVPNPETPSSAVTVDPS